MAPKHPPRPKALVGSVSLTDSDANLSETQLIGYDPVTDRPDWAASIPVNADGTFGGTGALDEKLRVPHSGDAIELYLAGRGLTPADVIASHEPSTVYTPQDTGSEFGINVKSASVIRSTADDSSATDEQVPLRDSLNNGDIDLSVMPPVDVNSSSSVSLRVRSADVIVDGSVIHISEGDL